MNSKAFRTGLGQRVTGAIHLEEGQGKGKGINLI